MAIINATILFEKRFWVGIFERTDKEGYAVAKHIFGEEPSDPEIYEFVISHFSELEFGEAKKVNVIIRRMNRKRVQREIRREMKKMKETQRPSTLAQDYMREEIEKKKKEKKSILKSKKEAYQHQQFMLKQEKKKKKQRGR